MNHRGTTTLATQRLILRRAASEDAEAGFANYASDPEVTRYLTWSAYESVEPYRQYLFGEIENYPQADHYSWLIELKGVGVVGAIAFVQVDESTETLDIGYVLGRKWWNQGMMTEAFLEVMRFGFEEVGANRITGRHDVRNPRSGRVMQKCGMTYEGTLRQAARGNDGVVDICHYSILASEWRARR